MNDDWLVAKLNPEDKLAQVHTFSLMKPAGDLEIEFRITVHEYGPGEDVSRRFVARASTAVTARR